MAVELDLKECTYFDAACLGQFMLLLKVQRNRGQPQPVEIDPTILATKKTLPIRLRDESEWVYQD